MLLSSLIDEAPLRIPRRDAENSPFYLPIRDDPGPKARDDRVPEHDATVATWLNAAGAVIIGKSASRRRTVEWWG